MAPTSSPISPDLESILHHTASPLTIHERLGVVFTADLTAASSRRDLSKRLHRLSQAVFPEARLRLLTRRGYHTNGTLQDTLTLPLRTAGEDWGSLRICRSAASPFDDDDVAVAKAIAALVATALGNLHKAADHAEARQARHLSERRFSALFEQFPLSVQLFDQQGQTLAVNLAWRDLFGLTLDQVRDFNPLTDPQLESIRPFIQRGFAGETVTIPSHPFRTDPFTEDEAQRFWIETTVCPIHAPDGSITETIIIHRDVTEAREVLETLRDRERQLQEAQRIAHLGDWRWIIADNKVTWSDELYRIYGLDPQQFGASFEAYLERVHPDDRAHVQKQIQRSIKTGKPFDFEERILRPDGSIRVLQSSGEVLRDEKNRIAGLIGVCHDVTALKEAEEAIRISEASYRIIFEMASDAIYVHDIETGEVLDANRQACVLHGRTLDELKRLGIGGLSPRPPYDDEHARAFIQQAAAGKPQRFEWLAGHAKGSERWVEVYLSRVSILGEDRVLASVRDISERKEAEQVLQQAHDELERRVAERTAALAQAEQRFRAIVEASPVPLLLNLIEDGTVLYANERMEVLLGAEENILTGYKTPDFYYDPEARAPLIKQVQEQGYVQNAELRLKRLDGSPRWVSLSIQKLPFDGKPAFATALVDITERKEVEQALRERTEELEAIFHALPDLYFRMEADGTILAYRAGRSFGLYAPPEAFLGQKVQEVLPPPVGPQVGEALTEVTRTGNLVQIEYVLPLGHVPMHFEARLVPLTGGQIIAVVRDVTQRVEAEQTLRLQKTLLEAQGESSIDGILVVSGERDILSYNQRFVELWGILPAVIASGSDEAALQAVFDKLSDPQAFLERVAYLYERPDEKSRDEILLRDGRTFDRYSSPLRSREGDHYGRIWFFRDITAQKHHAEELEQAQQETRKYAESLERSLDDLQRAQERLIQQEKMASLGRLTSGIAHEIKNPLNFVINFAELNEETVLDLRSALADQDAEYADELLGDLETNLQKIADHGRRADAIVKSMMAHAQVGSDKQSLQQSAVDLNRIIVEQLDVLLHYRQQQGRIPIQIERRLGQNLGSIEALPHDLSRVVQNLLTNALEAVEERASQRDVTPTVPPYLPTVTIRTEAKNRCILMTVSDNGIGVPDTVLDRIFEPFVTTKPAGSGHTGLGLSLLHDTVVGRYGGTVLLLPSNEGATFRVELPSSAA